MKTKRINAGLKSPAELAQRLQDGEVFWLGGLKLFYDASDLETSPFRADRVSMCDSWHCYAEMEVEVEVDWRDDLGDGVLCWVWDENPNCFITHIITEYHSSHRLPYKGGTRWVHARPMTLEEATKYIYECRE